MKKTKLIALCVSMILLVGLVSACDTHDPVDPITIEIGDFIESHHDKTEDYRRSFDTYALPYGNLEFHVDKTLYEADPEQAQALFQIIANNYLVLDRIFDLQSAVKVYVVSSRNFAEGGFNSGENVYYIPEDITVADHRPHLTSSYIQTSEPWKVYGATMYAFEEAGEDHQDFLSAYYSDEDNILTLSLFAAYFNEAFADAETIEAAQWTATDFSRYLIDEHGTEYFLNAGLAADGRQEWLDSMGIAQTYTMPYDLSWLEGATYPSQSAYESAALSPASFIMETPNRLYYLEPVSQAEGAMVTDVFDTPLLVLEELSENHGEMQKVLSYIEEHAPLSYPQILSKYQEKISYYTSPLFSISSANADSNQVKLRETGAFVHETIHVLTINGIFYSGAWLEEGLAEYFSVYISDQVTAKQMRSFTSFGTDMTAYDFVDDEGKFIELCIAYYESKGKEITTFENYDHELLYEALGVVALTNPDLNYAIPFPLGTSIVSSYPEACLFVRYLIENYGLDTVLSIALAETYEFEDYFGISRDEAFGEFLSQVQGNR